MYIVIIISIIWKKTSMLAFSGISLSKIFQTLHDYNLA